MRALLRKMTRSETDFERSVRRLYTRKNERKKHISRTDDGGAVVAHHAHDERVCCAGVYSIKAFVCSLK